MTLETKYILYARKSSESEDKQVASIASQIDELKALAKKHNLTIVSILTEEKSAKAPGRPIFSQMISDIHAGKANGIICWKLDRLARNPVDGGTVSWMLQQNLLKHIQTFQRGYLPNDNVLMMSLEFGMANQYIIDLSVNVKRGHRNRVNNAWYPHKPPIGYLNNKYQHPDLTPIYKDPVTFPIMKQLWDMLLTKKYTLITLHKMAKQMGLKTTRSEKPIGRATFFRCFRNPFYYGAFVWKGDLYTGKHETMISKTEFDLAQRIIDGRASFNNPKHHFAFTGLIKCGQCGASITAEEKFKHQKNGNTHHYTYYRCTKRVDLNCPQKPIRQDNLIEQTREILESITIPPEFHQWAIKYLKEEQSKECSDREDILSSYRSQLDVCVRKLENLLNMRVNNEINPDEYTLKKEQLLKDKAKFEELLNDAHHRVEDWLKRAEEAFDFAETAKERFENGSLEDKREILSCLGSNLFLKDRVFYISDANPLFIFKDIVPRVQALHNRLEPTQTKRPQWVWERLYADDAIIRGWRDQVRTCFMAPLLK